MKTWLFSVLVVTSILIFTVASVRGAPENEDSNRVTEALVTKLLERIEQLEQRVAQLEKRQAQLAEPYPQPAPPVAPPIAPGDPFDHGKPIPPNDGTQQLPTPAIPAPPPDFVPDGWQRREFNGLYYYIVPLDSGGQPPATR